MKSIKQAGEALISSITAKGNSAVAEAIHTFELDSSKYPPHVIASKCENVKEEAWYPFKWEILFIREAIAWIESGKSLEVLEAEYKRENQNYETYRYASQILYTLNQS